VPGTNNRFEVVSRKAVLQNAIGSGLSAVGPGSAVRKKQTNGKISSGDSGTKQSAVSDALFPLLSRFYLHRDRGHDLSRNWGIEVDVDFWRGQRDDQRVTGLLLADHRFASLLPPTGHGLDANQVSRSQSRAAARSKRSSGGGA